MSTKDRTSFMVGGNIFVDGVYVERTNLLLQWAVRSIYGQVWCACIAEVVVCGWCWSQRFPLCHHIIFNKCFCSLSVFCNYYIHNFNKRRQTLHWSIGAGWMFMQDQNMRMCYPVSKLLYRSKITEHDMTNSNKDNAIDIFILLKYANPWIQTPSRKCHCERRIFRSPEICSSSNSLAFFACAETIIIVSHYII